MNKWGRGLLGILLRDKAGTGRGVTEAEGDGRIHQSRLSALLGQKLKSNGTDGSEIGSNFTDGKDENLVWGVL